eukprot:8697704-Pyramimonas_sp.AAC.1
MLGIDFQRRAAASRCALYRPTHRAATAAWAGARQPPDAPLAPAHKGANPNVDALTIAISAAGALRRALSDLRRSQSMPAPQPARRRCSARAAALRPAQPCGGARVGARLPRARADATACSRRE